MKRTLIRGGRLIDPARKIDSKLDLLLEDGKVAAVLASSEGLSVLADEVIEAGGQVVCPGFIDIHMHEDPVRKDGTIEQSIFPAMLRMGVTTVLAGNCGENLYDPVSYLSIVDRDGAAVNVAMMAGHSSFRKAAGASDKYKKATPDQVNRMKSSLAAALEQGLMGISFGLRYVPGTTTQEFLAAASAAVPGRCLVSAHVRDDAAYVFESVAEFARAGETYDLPLQVSHIGSMGGFGQMEQLLRQMDIYRGNGMDIAADCYPYYAFSTSIGASTYDDGWMERYGCDYGAVVLCEGKYKGQRCTEEIFNEMRRDNPEALTICRVMRAKDIHAAYRHPCVMVGSDGLVSKGQGHPRAAGTFPRFLAEFVRNGREIGLYDAIFKMTAFPASRMGLKKKGTLAAGSDADVVIFDPDNIYDRATFEEPMLPPEGISCVLVGGEMAVKEGQMISDRLGKAVRRA